MKITDKAITHCDIFFTIISAISLWISFYRESVGWVIAGLLSFAVSFFFEIWQMQRMWRRAP